MGGAGSARPSSRHRRAAGGAWAALVVGLVAWALAIKIAITVEAFEAIARTLPLGSVGVERDPGGWSRVCSTGSKLSAGRARGYSDVILRLVAAGDGMET